MQKMVQNVIITQLHNPTSHKQYSKEYEV